MEEFDASSIRTDGAFNYQHLPLKSELNVRSLREGAIVDIDEERAHEMGDEALAADPHGERDIYRSGTDTENYDNGILEKEYFKMVSIMTDVTPTKDRGVLKYIHKPSTKTSQVPMKGDFVKTQVILYAEGLDEPFDNTWLRDKPIYFKIDGYEVFYGLDVAVQSMQVGEISVFVISPDYGFGPLGAPPRIPADTRILAYIWFTDILHHHKDDDDDHDNDSLASSNSNLTMEEVLKQIEKALGMCKGNLCKKGVQQSDYKKSLSLYRKCLSILEPRLTGDEQARDVVLATLQKLYNNCSLCFIKLGKWNETISMARAALKLDVKPLSKSHYLMGKAYLAKNESKKAHEHLYEAKNIQQGVHNAELNQALKQLQVLEVKESEQEKELAQKMCSGLSNLNNPKSCPSPSSPSSQKFLQQIREESNALHGENINGVEDEQKMEELLKQVDDNFKESIIAKLKSFRANKSLPVLTVPKVSFTYPQIIFLVNEAEKINCDLSFDDSDRVIQISKRKKTKKMNYP